MRADLVTVYHNDTNREWVRWLRDGIARHEPGGGYRFIAVDNRTTNRGFARACNLGARAGDAPVIGFLNPDTVIDGPFLDAVTDQVLDSRTVTVITGCRFAKPEHELKIWGVHDWVCGAAFFVNRHWFESVDGFDEQFTWSWEETDLIRHAQEDGWRVKSIPLPIRHVSPQHDTPEDTQYKQLHFSRGQQRYYRKWGTTR